MRYPGLVPITCGALAAGLAALSIVVSLEPAGWDLSALPRVGSATGIGAAAKAIDPGFHTVDVGAYDGQWYWGIAVDPVATGDVHQSFDNAAYRYSHPLYGWLGWLVSAGQASTAPVALVFVGLVSMLAAGIAAAVLGRGLGGTGWAGLFVAVNPGLIYSASHDLTEPLSAALLLGGLLAYTRGRRRAAVACFALLVLSKEPYVTVPLALAAWELWHRRARLVDTAALAASVLPAAAWWVYVRIHLGAWFTSASDTALVWPLSGWRTALHYAGLHSYDPDPTQNQFGEATIVVVLALGGLLLVAGVLAARLRGPTDAVLLPLLVFVACLSPTGTVYERDLLRAAAVALVLVPFSFASRTDHSRRASRE